MRNVTALGRLLELRGASRYGFTDSQSSLSPSLPRIPGIFMPHLTIWLIYDRVLVLFLRIRKYLWVLINHCWIPGYAPLNALFSFLLPSKFCLQQTHLMYTNSDKLQTAAEKRIKAHIGMMLKLSGSTRGRGVIILEPPLRLPHRRDVSRLSPRTEERGEGSQRRRSEAEWVCSRLSASQ